MTKEKRNLVLFSSVAVALVVLVIVFVLLQRKKKEEEEIKAEQVIIQQQQAVIDNSIVKPKLNRNGELENSFAELKGRKLIARSKTNIRASAGVNNPTWYAESQTNILGSVPAGTVIGTIVSESRGTETPAMRWFKVKLIKPIKVSFQLGTGLYMVGQFFADGAPGTYEYGYVRADVATFNQYKK